MDTQKNINPNEVISTVIPRDQIVSEARSLVSVILEKTCKQYCFSNRNEYQCTIDSSWGRNENDTALCEWGNATYVWMIEQLVNERRLEKIAHEKELTSIRKYYNKILHSLPFRERFKDWRFRRRIQVPVYIKALDKDASKVFWYLCDNDEPINIAQRLKRSEGEIRDLIKLIKIELSKRGSMQLLNPASVISLTSLEETPGVQIKAFVKEDSSVFEIERTEVLQVFKQLSWQEQFIIQAMVMDGLSAESVTLAVKQQGVILKNGLEPEQHNAQHIYYFLRKSLKKMRQMLEEGVQK